MDKDRRRGLRRAVNKHHTRAYQRDHRQTRSYGQYCWRHNDHRHREKDCRSCRKTRYYCNSNEAALDAEFRDYSDPRSGAD